MNKKGFIKSSKGQWAHPGKKTLIPNAKGKITMKGVNYPVLGIDDQGNRQLMLPGAEYQFPGNSVYEIPMAQNGGGWLDNAVELEKTRKQYRQNDKNIKDFAINYTNSDNYKQMLNKSGYTQDQIKQRQSNIKNLDLNNDVKHTLKGPSYVYTDDKNKQKIDYNIADPGDWPIEDLQAHEWGHLEADDNTQQLSKKDQYFLKTRINKEGLSEKPDDLEHDLNPNENRADLFQLRYQLKKHGIYDSIKGGKFNIQMLDKLRQKGDWNRMFRLYKDKDIEYLMNNVAQKDENNNQSAMLQNGGWLDTLQKGGSAKLLNRSRKEIIKQRELEDKLKKEGFDEDGVFTRVLPEYTVKSPEKKLYDEAYNKFIAQQQAFQNSWYPGSTDSDNLGYAPGVMDNIKQRATVKANDFVAKNLVDNNNVQNLYPYQKEYINDSNYSGKLRPNIGKQFTEGVQDLKGIITQGKLPTSKSLGILSPLEYPVNLVRGTVKGEGVDALKGKISSPWLDANDVDPGAVNEVGVYNTIADIGMDPLNLPAGILPKVSKLNKLLKTSSNIPNITSNSFIPSSSKIKFKGVPKYDFLDTEKVLTDLRNEGQYWDNLGASNEDFLHPDMIEYHGTYAGRPIVEVKMPNGKSTYFYKSTSWGGKEGTGINRTTEGMWQIYGGHSQRGSTPNWFIKDDGYKSYYGSKTFQNMANNMNNALINKYKLPNSELDNFLNFQNKISENDTYIPKKYGGWLDNLK